MWKERKTRKDCFDKRKKNKHDPLKFVWSEGNNQNKVYKCIYFLIYGLHIDD
jgi:hypothetical protein